MPAPKVQETSIPRPNVPLGTGGYPLNYEAENGGQK